MLQFAGSRDSVSRSAQSSAPPAIEGWMDPGIFVYKVAVFAAAFRTGRMVPNGTAPANRGCMAQGNVERGQSAPETRA